MENLGKQAFTGAAKFILSLLVLIFLPAWTVYYWQGWLYLAVFGTATLLQTAYLLRHDRALLARRLKAGPGTFTSGIVEIAPEQQVISTGPYALVRHPMYSGAVILFMCTPLALGSYWALIASFLLCLVMVVRILDEERFLSAHLNGYQEYKGKTRYRLLPWVW
ncbi:isoprenylcysteine carboxylmethyltransferase family protein [Chitinophaga sp. GbtcB8]|uniref:methyltransferase family protein n=1 Tax=Chitinophaga sp. GbtcB8 TaxID=2824753 RepID=UPI001C2F0EFA|nr:isoprenylcysteine carboxylmethyltransferase family protein [Chitinophaga sp. GbtcB8]